MEMEEHVPLAPLTTFSLGGPARFFVRAKSITELKEALAFAKKDNTEIFILGGGSNILIPDEGWNGLVIKIELTGIGLESQKETTLLIAAAGEEWDSVVERAAREQLWGIENLSGIPGTVGGAVVQNIGAYGQAISQTLHFVEVLDSENGEIKKMLAEECAFQYRDSFFKHDRSRHIVLRAAFALSTDPSPDLSYKDLALWFKDSSLDMNAIREAVIAIRKNKFPDLSVEGTAGSFFKNPILPAEEARRLQARYPSMPLFLLPESADTKIPLGWLLDYRHGVMDARTLSVGGARMYEKQFLVIAARRNSSANDVRELAGKVQREVKEKIGIDIEPEVRIL